MTINQRNIKQPTEILICWRYDGNLCDTIRWIHSFFSKGFILVEVDLKSVPGIPGTSREFTLDGTSVHLGPLHTHTHTRLHLWSWQTGMFLGRGRNLRGDPKGNAENSGSPGTYHGSWSCEASMMDIGARPVSAFRTLKYLQSQLGW